MNKSKVLCQALFFLSAIILLILTILRIRHSSGILIYLELTCVLTAGLVILRQFHWFFGFLKHRDLQLSFYSKLWLVIFSCMLVLIAFEGYLHFQHSQKGITDTFPLTMPEEWNYHNVEVEGAKSATYWHGKLHVYNDENMRRSTPFPPKDPKRCRIMILGDSLTYGKGVSLEETYPAVLEELLSKEYAVEVLNLGICGIQSEEILQILLRYAPQLRPDIVLYGMCQNDFLERGEGQESRAVRNCGAFPLPKAFKEFMIEKTLSGKFFEERYDKLLMKFGVRADFQTNILKDMYHYQIRFTRDVTVMNLFAVQNGLPPIVAMVLDQVPDVDGAGHEVTRLAESILELVGVQVVPTEDYYETYDGQRMQVSPWEGHPNTTAHRLFAEYFAQTLQQHPILQKYRK